MSPNDYQTGNAQAQRLPSFAPDAGTVAQAGIGGVAQVQPSVAASPTLLDSIYQLANRNLNDLQDQFQRLDQLAGRLGIPQLPEANVKPAFDSPTGEGTVSNIRDMGYLTTDAITRLKSVVDRLEQL